MKILVTGAAGFIGFHICIKLLNDGYEVVGIDSINDYYDVDLKYNRLKALGFLKNKVERPKHKSKSQKYSKLSFYKADITNYSFLTKIFAVEKFDIVCHLAAQAGVRYSIQNPKLYIESNINGFINILECSKQFKISHLIYASSSSVYGESTKIPFSVSDRVDKPISLYAATKKSNELMAYTYSHLFGLKTTGLRFFTVYGPWGRPDMAYFLFTKAIIENNPIKVFNNGLMQRDFTYIDDITDGVLKLIKMDNNGENYKLYNLGNNKPESLKDFIKFIESSLNKAAKTEMLPIQPGDVSLTCADISDSEKDFNYKPKTPLKVGISRFVDWYLQYNS